MTKHIDYDIEAKLRTWWLNGTGGAAKDGLTVRDYFAAKIMVALLIEGRVPKTDIPKKSYEMSDEMMQARVLDNQGEL